MKLSPPRSSDNRTSTASSRRIELRHRAAYARPFPDWESASEILNRVKAGEGILQADNGRFVVPVVAKWTVEQVERWRWRGGVPGASPVGNVAWIGLRGTYLHITPANWKKHAEEIEDLGVLYPTHRLRSRPLLDRIARWVVEHDGNIATPDGGSYPWEYCPISQSIVARRKFPA